MSPIIIQKLSSGDPDLEQSKLLDAIYKSVSYADEHGGIGLTQNKAFNRKFCHWAAENFNWEEYSASKLLKYQKVLNEEDVIPVMVLHDLFVGMKLGRHIKGKFQFNKKAFELLKDKGLFFNTVANFYLFEFDHHIFQRRPFVAPGNWDIFLNVINVEAHGGASEDHFLDVFYGVTPDDIDKLEYWDYASFLRWQVLNPLYWIGFLDRTDTGDILLDRESHYIKTPLWRKCLRLDTDKDLKPHIIH
jgi:hypothetical protein